ncbi:cytochrome c oxidase subunit II [Halorientalis pallida]|uniref:cytochrome c oxidase subunit II n=1 Tax=Halorientalis pallida TaxID=2479928 RepID=UPI003C6EF9B6
MADRPRALLLATGGVSLLAGLLLAVSAEVGGYASTTDAVTGGLARTLLAIAVPATLLAEGALAYALVRDDAPLPANDRRLELAWTAGMALVVLVVGVVSYQAMASPAVSGSRTDSSVSPDAVTVEVVASQWNWRVTYPDAGVTVRDRIVLPANRTVRLKLRSRDVIHALSVPGLALRRDAFPGRTTTIRTTPTRPGSYRLYCAEYCGSGHARMTGRVVVVPPDDYRDWLDDPGTTLERTPRGH